MSGRELAYPGVFPLAHLNTFVKELLIQSSRTCLGSGDIEAFSH